jgi:hypothetical protein
LSAGTAIFVHGTGVRLAGFEKSYAAAVRQAEQCSFTPSFVPWAWGDALGVQRNLRWQARRVQSGIGPSTRELLRWRPQNHRRSVALKPTALSAKNKLSSRTTTIRLCLGWARFLAPKLA